MLAWAIINSMLCLLLLVLNHFIREDLRERWYLGTIFRIVLLMEAAIGVTAFLLKSAEYAEDISMVWLNVDDIILTLQLGLNSTVALVGGVFSLLLFGLLLVFPSIWRERKNFTSIVSFNCILWGLLLAQDVISFSFFWFWQIALLLIIANNRTEDVLNKRFFSPALGAILLFFANLILMVFSGQTLFSNNALARLAPELRLTTGILVGLIILLQAAQFPFPNWLANFSESESSFAKTFLFHSGTIIAPAMLLLKYLALISPYHLTGLAIAGFFTLIISWHEAQQVNSSSQRLWSLYTTGCLGSILVGLLAPNQIWILLFLSVLISIALVLIVWAYLHIGDTIIIGAASQSPTTSLKSWQIVVALILSGAPLTLTYNLKLSLLSAMLGGTSYSPFYRYSLLSLMVLSTFLITWVAFHTVVSLKRVPTTDNKIFPLAYPAFRLAGALAICILLICYLPYTLSGINPFSANVSWANWLGTGAFLQPVNQIKMSQWTANLLLFGSITVAAFVFIFFGEKLTYTAIPQYRRDRFLIICLFDFPDKLSQLVTRLNQKIARWSTTILAKSLDNVSSLPSHLNATVISKSQFIFARVTAVYEKLIKKIGHGVWSDILFFIFLILLMALLIVII